MTTLTSKRELPNHGCFVLSNDSFMSGWRCIGGRINTVILHCDSIDEAKIVANNAANRSDQKHIRTYFYRKPRLNFQTHLYSYHTKDDYGSWYEPNHQW